MPFNFNKTFHRWDNNGDSRYYIPVYVRVPRIAFVSIWDFFPDPNATSISECEYVVHRHRLNRTQLSGLGKMPYFDKESIRNCLRMGPNYVEKGYEKELIDNPTSEESGQLEVREYW